MATKKKTKKLKGGKKLEKATNMKIVDNPTGQ